MRIMYIILKVAFLVVSVDGIDEYVYATKIEKRQLIEVRAKR